MHYNFIEINKLLINVIICNIWSIHWIYKSWYRCLYNLFL